MKLPFNHEFGSPTNSSVTLLILRPGPTLMAPTCGDGFRVAHGVGEGHRLPQRIGARKVLKPGNRHGDRCRANAGTQGSDEPTGEVRKTRRNHTESDFTQVQKIWEVYHIDNA